MSVKEEDVKYIAKTDLGHDHTVIALLIVFFYVVMREKPYFGIYNEV